MGYELYRRQRGGPWSVYFLTREGDRFRRSTKQTDRRLATAVADEWYRRRADPTYQAANETSVQQAVRCLMQALEDAGKRPATRRFYAEKCGHIARLFGPDLPLARIDAKLVDSYIRDRKREGAARYTISKELTALRQMLKHARRRGEFDKELSQVMPIGFATGYKPRERRLTMAQAWALIGDLPEGPARYVAYVCAVTARDAAVPRARGKHLTSVGVLVLDGKTSRSTRLVPVPQLLYPFLFRAFWGVSDEAMVAPGVSSVRHALDRACARLKLPHISPNDLRRSVAHWLLEAGVPRDVAAAYMGHANTKMLDMVYGKLDPKELGAALTRALPPAQDDVDLVWTTPADPGDEGDSGRGASSGNTCAGGDLNTGHADFQSACDSSVSPVGGVGSVSGVDAVWNPARSVPGKLRDAADGAGNWARGLGVTQAAPALQCPDCDGSGRVFVQHGDGYNFDAEDCRMCGGRGGWSDVTGEEKDDGGTEESRRSVADRDGQSAGRSDASIHCDRSTGSDSAGDDASGSGSSDEGTSGGRRGGVPEAVRIAQGLPRLAPATLPAREGEETSEEALSASHGEGLVNLGLSGSSCGRTASSVTSTPAEAPKSRHSMGAPVYQLADSAAREVDGSSPSGSPRHSSHWLGPCGVYVDGLLSGRTT